MSGKTSKFLDDEIRGVLRLYSEKYLDSDMNFVDDYFFAEFETELTYSKYGNWVDLLVVNCDDDFVLRKFWAD